MSPSRSRPEALRSAWLLPACAGFIARKMPFHLMELGATDGLALIADYLPRPELRSEKGEVLPGPAEYALSPYPILSRTGLSAEPAPSAEALFAALSRETSGPKLERCPEERQLDEAKSRAPRAYEGLLLFSASRRQAQARRAFEERLAALMEPWGDRAFFVELEPEDSGACRVRVSRAAAGALDGRVLARVDGAAGTIVPGTGWDFLQPLSFERPPRVTIEEPPRQLEPGTYKGSKLTRPNDRA